MSCLAQSLWKTKNGWIFNGVMIKSPVAAHKVIGFLNKWRKTARKEEV
jgi:hypothetical protein